MIDIIYEDASIVIVSKPPGVLSVPGVAIKESMTTQVEQRFGETHVVHRLDCETSGVMVFARSKAAQKELHRQFREREVYKVYEALGYGRCEQDAGLIDLPLIADWPNRPKQKVDFEQGKPSHTLWQRIEQHSDYTRFSLKPITGRSHQLRVHLKVLGHPILGDKLYASAIRPISGLFYPNMCLHAKELRIVHPDSQAPMMFKSPVPF